MLHAWHQSAEHFVHVPSRGEPRSPLDTAASTSVGGLVVARYASTWRHGHLRGILDGYKGRQPNFHKWARPAYEQGALPKLSVEGSNLQKPLDLPGSAARTSSLRNKTVHTKSFPKLSHFYTTNTQAKCLCTCCFVSFCWRVTSLTQKAAFMPHVDIFMSTLTKTRKNTCQP